MDEDVDDIPYVDSSLYVWPPAIKDDECYSHITNFKVIDENNEYVDLLSCAADVTPPPGQKKNYRAIGTLVPPADSEKKQKRTQFPVLNYAIDFGPDENRGFWLSDRYDVWYKLEQPDESYAPYSDKAFRFTMEFLKLMDVLVKPDRHGLSHSKLKGGLYSCDKSLEFLYQATNHAFDFDVLTEDSALLYNRLETLFVAECVLLKHCCPTHKPGVDIALSPAKSTFEATSPTATKPPVEKPVLVDLGGSSSSDENLFDSDFNPDEPFSDPPGQNDLAAAHPRGLTVDVLGAASEPLSVGALVASNQIASSGVSKEKRTKLGPDWVRGDERSSQTLTIDDINNKAASAAPTGDELSVAKSKVISIRKRSQKLVPTAPRFNEGNSSASKHPAPGQILKAKVAYIESFGLFMQLCSPYGTGMVHNSQISFSRDTALVKKSVHIHQEFFVKVLKVFPSSDRTGDKINVELSIKYCEQLGGTDLDPDWEKYDHECEKKEEGKGRSASRNIADSRTGSRAAPVGASSFFPRNSTDADMAYPAVHESHRTSYSGKTDEAKKIEPVKDQAAVGQKIKSAGLMRLLQKQAKRPDELISSVERKVPQALACSDSSIADTKIEASFASQRPVETASNGSRGGNHDRRVHFPAGSRETSYSNVSTASAVPEMPQMNVKSDSSFADTKMESSFSSQKPAQSHSREGNLDRRVNFPDGSLNSGHSGASQVSVESVKHVQTNDRTALGQKVSAGLLRLLKAQAKKSDEPKAQAEPMASSSNSEYAEAFMQDFKLEVTNISAKEGVESQPFSGMNNREEKRKFEINFKGNATTKKARHDAEGSSEMNTIKNHQSECGDDNFRKSLKHQKSHKSSSASLSSNNPANRKGAKNNQNRDISGIYGPGGDSSENTSVYNPKKYT